MAIEPNKLAAFATSAKGGAPLDEMMAATRGEPAETAPDEAAPEETTGEEGGEDRFAALRPLLAENAEAIVAASEEVDPDALKNFDEPLDDNNVEIMTEDFSAFPDDLRDALEQDLVDLTPEEAAGLADELAAQGAADDVETLSAYFYQLGVLIGEGRIAQDPDGDEDEDDEEEEPEDDEEFEDDLDDEGGDGVDEDELE